MYMSQEVGCPFSEVNTSQLVASSALNLSFFKALSKYRLQCAQQHMIMIPSNLARTS